MGLGTAFFVGDASRGEAAEVASAGAAAASDASLSMSASKAAAAALVCSGGVAGRDVCTAIVAVALLPATFLVVEEEESVAASSSPSTSSMVLTPMPPYLPPRRWLRCSFCNVSILRLEWSSCDSRSATRLLASSSRWRYMLSLRPLSPLTPSISSWSSSSALAAPLPPGTPQSGCSAALRASACATFLASSISASMFMSSAPISAPPACDENTPKRV